MSGGSDRIDKLNFELTQSVTASDGSVFGKGDTVEVSFVGKGTPYHGAYTNVFVDLYYAADKSSPSWTRINSTEYPKRFYLPTVHSPIIPMSHFSLTPYARRGLLLTSARPYVLSTSQKPSR